MCELLDGLGERFGYRATLNLCWSFGHQPHLAAVYAGDRQPQWRKQAIDLVNFPTGEDCNRTTQSPL